MVVDRNTGIDASQLKNYTLTRQDLSPDGLVWQEPVIDKDLTTPPGSPSEDDRYLIISGGSGTDWAGHDNDIAHYHGSQWNYYTPIEGWIIWIKDENEYYKFNGTTWSKGAGIQSTDVDDFTIKYSGGIIKIADRIELNQMLNAFRIAINGSLSQFNMVDGITDEYEDESGVDTVNSTNEDYDSSNDLYKPDETVALELDYMEYASDGAAQTAYVSSDSTPVESLIDSYSETNYTNKDKIAAGITNNELGQALTLSSAYSIKKVKFYLSKLGSPTGSVYVRIYAATGTVGSTAVPTGSVLATSDAVDVSTLSVDPTLTLQEFTFSTPYEASAGDYCIMCYYNGGDGSNCVYVGWDATSPTHDGNYCRNVSGADANADTCFYLYAMVTNLQCYSEGTIKNQGSYSLKAVALITDSLNDTLTKSGLSLDLTDKDELKLWAYASRTGTNIQIQIHDSGGTTSTKDIVISSATTWTEITWDISGISNANKDDIDSIIIKIINADVANTFYIDNFYAVGVVNNMTLISNSETAEVQPDTARIVLFEEDVDSITLQTDLKAYASRDGGTTYTQGTLSDEGDYQSGKRILTALIDISGQPSGTSMEYKIESLNNKLLKLHGVGLLWD